MIYTSEAIRVNDPSTLTTDQIQREIGSLEKLLTSRLSGVEKAVEVAHENLVRVPTDVEKAVGHLSQIMIEKFATNLEKFHSVQTQFQERDVRTEQTQKDSKVAVDAALQAAKEAVGKQQEASDRAIAKSEAATTKQLESIISLISSNTKASDEKIDDLKQRLGRIEGQDIGQRTAVTTQQTSNTAWVGVIGLVLGSLIGIGGLAMAFTR